jgi:hypothetical protein
LAAFSHPWLCASLLAIVAALFFSPLPRHKNPKDTKRECEATANVENKKQIKRKIGKNRAAKKRKPELPKEATP